VSARTVGDVIAETTTCTVLNAEGEACGHTGQAGLPVGVCLMHAITITRAVMRMGGIVVKETR
jgi:hypothetical protein